MQMKLARRKKLVNWKTRDYTNLRVYEYITCKSNCPRMRDREQLNEFKIGKIQPCNILSLTLDLKVYMG